MSQGILSRPADVGGAARGVRIVSPAPRNVWQGVLDADPLAVPTQTPGWTDLVCATTGAADASRAYGFPGGRWLVLPMVARRVAGLRVLEESMPYGFGYGGLLAAGGPPTAEELQVVLADLARRPVIRAAVTPSPLAAAAWSAAAAPGTTPAPYLSHVLDLDGGFDAVWSTRYRPDTRRKVRRAMNESLDVRRVDDASIVPVFAGLNAQSVDRWAQQRGQPLWMARLVERRRNRVGLLRAAISQPGSRCVGWTAHRDGIPVAAYVALVHGASAFFWMSAMDKELADRTRAGVLLQSMAIEYACAEGARWFHLGESDAASGVARFKESFGAVPRHHEALRIERLPLTAADRRLHALAGRMTARARPDGEPAALPAVGVVGGQP